MGLRVSDLGFGAEGSGALLRIVQGFRMLGNGNWCEDWDNISGLFWSPHINLGLYDFGLKLRNVNVYDSVLKLRNLNTLRALGRSGDVRDI